MTRQELQQKLQKVQADVNKVFIEAKGGNGQLNFANVTKSTIKELIGEGQKSSADISKWVGERDAEMNDLGVQIDAYVAAERVEHEMKEREKGFNRPPMTGGGAGNYPSEDERFKSIGEMIVEDERYLSFTKGGTGSGALSLNFDDISAFAMISALASGYSFGSKALFATSAGWAPEVLRRQGFVEQATRPIQLLDILPTGQTGENGVKYLEETLRTDAAGAVAEGGIFPESAYELTEKTSPVEKIAHIVPVTDEQLADVPQAQGFINGRLMFGARQKLDTDCLIGSGTSSSLTGMKNVSGIQTRARGADSIPDALYKAMTSIRTVGRAIPTHIVMHSLDWQEVRLQKDGNGNYIWGPPSENGPARMWGLPVALNEADAAGTGYVGSFTPEHCELTERSGVEVEMGYVSDQFARGRKSMRATVRAALTFFKPAAFHSVTGLNA